ncbi:Holliday junction resolvase RuvX [Aurantimicrobium minutum]|uniref:Holliday junction resolvase RuvX n=1 Tax=Aurantimicrobium minutum TaxID=708131 RepID=UPI002406B905|nr:Holliday junction resolvase RuvX [Aurantimicrobium minutum]MDF9809994.1 putative Holliday junction resolvase [Aurantimicrobium minutum]MDH6207794.1 putative Holliday junction resolvase [Aurantimicrobium minutum]MDH6409202.1 putative Holliday junction resolvase [Aurantimicrobium minutum]MDH6536655.1 putative Holliday junction resolvase [Aurantimicrobium minutum]
MRSGVRVGIDIGTVRIGVARSDRDGYLATPVETVDRGSENPIGQLVSLIAELEAIEVIVGLPLSLNGSHTASTEDALVMARELGQNASVPVRLVDERLTTVSAHSALRAAGKKQKQTRSVIDQVAAVMILQHALDSERSSGNLPGKDISEFPAQS